MKYSGIIYNDITASPGLSVTFFTQGCPHHCSGCHNPETWDFNGGMDFTTNMLDLIVEGLNAQNIPRNFCLMGGEPLCDDNLFLSYLILNNIKEKSPDTKIYIWTGYTYEQLLQSNNSKIKNILNIADYLIDGVYIDSLRDITLDMRGSSNQNIIDLKFDK